MKNIRTWVIAMLLLYCNTNTQAQILDASQPGVTLSQITAVAQAHLQVADTGEGGSQDRFDFFNTFWQDRAVANDSSGHTMFQEYYSGLASAVATRRDVTCTGPGFSGDWQVFGPDSTGSYQRQGKIDAIWADPTTGDTLLAGCTGGLFKSTDGGNNWHCVTDDAPLPGGTIGVCHIAVNPLNHNTIYLGTGMLDEEFVVDGPLVNLGGDGFGAGILESYDGGNTWTQEFIPTGSGYNDTIEQVQRVYISPDSNRIYAFSGTHIYTRPNNPVGDWVNITPPSISPHCAWWDLQFLPGDQNHFFVCNTIGNDYPQAGIWASDTAVPIAANWNKITTGFTDVISGYFTADTSWAIMDMSVPDHDTLFFIARSDSSQVVNLYKYNLTGSTHTFTKISTGLYDYHPTQYKFKLIVSPAGTSNNHGLRNMYVGFAQPLQSHDNGQNFAVIGQYNVGETHADIRDMCLQTATNTLYGNGDVLFCATDGGVSKKPAGVYDTASGANATIDISGHGLACAEFLGIGMSWDGRLMVGGEQHDGMMAYEQKQNPPWIDMSTVDAATAAFDNAHSAGVIFNTGGSPYQPYITYAAGGRQIGNVAEETNIPDNPLGTLFLSMYIDSSGNQYVGSTHLYELKFDSSSWTDYGAAHGLADTGGVYIRDMVFSEYDTNLTGYVLFRQNKGGQQQFEYRNPPVTTSSDFHYINNTPLGATAGYPMTSVAMDPTHAAKVWVGFGGINMTNTSTNRVNYSPDAGNTWYDVSNGLPLHVPVSKLVYQEGDSDVVFCATDAGIYRCNFSFFDASASNNGIQWTCFNSSLVAGKEFPNVFVTDMKINYCQQKLYAATYGRSIFVSDLYPAGAAPNATDTITSGTTTWGESKVYVTGGIEIENGATLTINADTVFMPKGGVVSVEAGGHLICNGCVITNSCDQCFWQGIQLNGSGAGTPQTAANDGWVTIKNGGVIANAMVGVTNYGGSGGIVQVKGGSFLDCHNDVTLANFTNILSSGTVASNLCYFYNTNFVLDNNYKGDAMNYPASYFVTLKSVSGVSFEGCNWLNRDNAATDRLQGYGLYCVDGGFSVGPYCPAAYSIGTGCLLPTPSRFCGFTNGMLLNGSIIAGTAFTSSIDHVVFDSCGIGINAATLNNISITADTFNVGNGLAIDGLNVGNGLAIDGLTGLCVDNIGIYSNLVGMFRMEGNTFTGNPYGAITTVPNWGNVGAAVVSSDPRMVASSLAMPPPVTVYRNTFSNLTYGVDALGNNNILSILCNTFEDNTADINISDFGSSYYQGINPVQGSLLQPAGNSFQDR